MRKTKVAVVGVGALGQHHARIYAEIPEADLVGVVDTDDERAERVAQNCNCPAFTDFSQIMGMAEAVSLAAPTEKHADLGKKILEQGIHLLVEKPIAGDLRGADLLIEAAGKQGVVLQVGHTERFNPALTPIRPLITTPQFFEAHRLGVFVPRSLDIDVVLDLMIHDLDMILHLTKSEVKDIQAVGIPVLTPRVDIANARLEFENGCVANLTASRVSKEKIRKLRFFQPNDYISVDFHGQSVEMYSLVAESTGKHIVERAPEIVRVEPLRLELQGFLAAVRGEPVEISCSGEQGRNALSTALKILGQIG